MGLIGLTFIHGNVGKLIEFGQWLDGSGFTQWEHSFISIGNGLVVEAEPGGARVAHASDFAVVHWCHGLYSLGTPAQHDNAAFYAKKFTEAGPWGTHGVPYSFLDYAALATHRLHIPVPGLKKFIATSMHMQCAQLVDRADNLAGIELFADNRWEGDVTPGDLYVRDLGLAQ
jgi:hypothetical protein